MSTLTQLTQLTERQETLVNGLADDFRPLVQKIESSIATTKNHYGRYGQILTQFGKGDRKITQVIFLALERAGANPQGLRDGFRNFV
jgi:hypothetical protein